MEYGEVYGAEPRILADGHLSKELREPREKGYRSMLSILKKYLRHRWLLSASLAAMAALMVQATLVWAQEAQRARDAEAPKFTNRLVDSNDPYLLLHAHNPVDWYPWGEEAIAKAKVEDKPIFISVGYSTCFWCHVAERTIYSNPDIAKLMNQWFVNVKIDSEQRPDLDRIYMLARQIMTGGGGWPNNLFLTPDLEPFYAGSYFPPQDDPGAGPGFPTILASLHDAWANKRSDVLEVARNVKQAIDYFQSQTQGGTVVPLQPKAWLAAARSTWLAKIDSEHGGIGDSASGTKFPRPPALEALLEDYRVHGTADSLAAVLQSLDAMAYGGIHDQLAGGFHRYSTEPTWSVPHFEKMLYDNAQLLRLYAEAFEITKKPIYAQIARKTADYLVNDMMDADGGFFTARDAQIEGVEGESYLWTKGQITSLLGEEHAARFLAAYNLTPLPRPDVPGLKHPALVDGEEPAVLRMRLPAEDFARKAGYFSAVAMIEALTEDRSKLLAARAKRRQPMRDEKLVVALNGMAISALLEAGKILDAPRYTDWAVRAADRIWAKAVDPKTGDLKHEIFRAQAQTDGFLQDYAFLGVAFLDLAEVTGVTQWQDRAVLLANVLLDRFVSVDGSLAVTAYESNLLVALVDDDDTVTPSGSSATLEFLLRLSAKPGQPRHREAAARIIRHLSGQFGERPDGWAWAVTVLNRHPLESLTEAVAKADAAANAETGAYTIPSTADHVKVLAATRQTAAGDELVVTLDIDKSYHVNANPASLNFLIPTTVEFEGALPFKITYPQPSRFKAAYAPEGIDILEGTATILARFPNGHLQKAGAQGTVTAQACTDKICLPPSTFSVSVKAVPTEKSAE